MEELVQMYLSNILVTLQVSGLLPYNEDNKMTENNKLTM